MTQGTEDNEIMKNDSEINFKVMTFQNWLIVDFNPPLNFVCLFTLSYF